jgi:hypothetical protein
MGKVIELGILDIGGYSAVKVRTKLLTNDESVDVTEIEVLVLPVELPLAVPTSGMLQVALEEEAAEQISASDFGIIFTS